MTLGGCYLKLDQTVLYNGNYSSSDKLTGTIYTDSALSSAFNLTGYTLTVRIYKRDHISDFFNKTATITVAASGTWYYAIAQGELPSSGLWLVNIELTKSGVQLNTLNNVEILIKRGPSLT